MNKFRLTINALAGFVFILGFMSVAQAQATRTWVSGVGDDANPCSRTAPCKTFAGAISKTATNGEINAIDSGGFGAVTITKSITIDGAGVMAGILNAGTTGIIINITNAADVRRTVRLRNLSIQGADTGVNGIRIVSGTLGGSEVFVEDCVIDGQQGSATAKGIEDFRTSGGLLVVSNTTIRNNASAGISVDPTGSGGASSTTIKVSISNSLVANNGFGTNFGSNVKATIFNSLIVGNTNNGVFAIQNSGGTTEVNVDHCVVSNNGAAGFNASSANTVIRVSNTNAVNNGSLAAVAGGGQVNSYGNNQTGGTAFPGAVGQT